MIRWISLVCSGAVIGILVATVHLSVGWLFALIMFLCVCWVILAWGTSS